MKNFALIGASGYIAPRHLKAIKDTNNNFKVEKRYESIYDECFECYEKILKYKI